MAQTTTNASLEVQRITILDAARIDPLDVSGLIHSLWRGKWRIALTTILAVLAAGYYAFVVAQPRFAATATLHIEASRNAAGDLTAQRGSVAVNLNTEAAILNSQHLLGQVVDQLDLLGDPEFNRYLTPRSPWSLTGMRTRLRNTLTGEVEVMPDQAAVARKTMENLRAAVTGQAQRDSRIFNVNATSASAEKSMRIANTLATLYLADQIQTQFAATDRAVNWLSEKVYEQQVALARKETAITDLIMLAQVSDEATLDAISRQAIETDERLRDARAALNRLTGNGQDAALVTTAARGDNAPRLRGQIVALEVLRARLAAQLAGQSAGLVQLNQLQREADATRVLYETFLTRLQEVSLHRGLQSPESRILNVAGPGRYVAPRKVLILAIAALLGFAGGIGWTFLREAMRTGFRDAATLAHATNLPVMGQLPTMVLRKPDRLLDHLATARSMPVHDAVRNLRTALLLSDADEPPQSILCTSSIADEGKTMLAITLAQNLANLGKSVLLLDGDQRGAGVSTYFSTTPAHELSAVINGDVALETAVARDPRWTVDVLTGQRGAAHTADLFCSTAFTAFMHRMRECYDYIVMDAPPVLAAPDARLLAQHSDAVVYTVRWNKTSGDLIMAGKRELDNVHAPITGLVLSQVDLRKMGKLGGVAWQHANHGFALQS